MSSSRKSQSTSFFLHENPHKSLILVPFFPSHHHGRHRHQKEEEPECATNSYNSKTKNEKINFEEDNLYTEKF